jgi:8-oxo-dGTP diphosphatase
MVKKHGKYNLHSLPVALVAADLCIFKIIKGDLCVYITKSESDAYEGMPCLPGSLIASGEEASKTLLRVLKDKTTLAIKDIYFEQLSTFSEVKRDKRSRVVAIAYMCLYKGSVTEGFVKVSSVRSLAYDHMDIMKTAVERLTSKMGYTTLVSKLIGDTFTYSELQKVYEVILHKTIDKRNFRKKIDSLQIIKDTGKKKQEGKMRPASLYKFTSDDVRIISILD